MNLYVKYRPSDFSEMEGNETTIKALESSIQKENHSHVYLFTGPAGTGKTTAARIMASKLGAEELDIREINSANNRGIDTARDIQNQIRQMPIYGNSIVYIIDEVHKTTSDWQNAMLKPLEDTPEHIYFFLCTTDPQKLIAPLKSRCTVVKFENLKTGQIYKILNRVKKLENLTVSKDVLEGIADKSEGCPRKALVLLERIISLPEEEQELFLRNYAIDFDDPEVLDLCRALLNENIQWKGIAELLKTLGESGKLDDSERVRYAILGYMNSVLLSGKLNKRAMAALESFSEPTFNNGKYSITLYALRTIL